MTEIGRIPSTGVFVGSYRLDPNVFSAHKIKTVLTILPVQPNEKKRFSGKGIKLIQIPIVNNELYGIKTVSNFLKITKKLKGAFAVTCLAGTGASNILAGSYLMAVKGWSFQKVLNALAHIGPYRPHGVEVVGELKQISSRLSSVMQKTSAKKQIFNRFLKIKRGL